MKPTLLHGLSMIPHLTALAGKAECLTRDYIGWELLEVDENTGEILICKLCDPIWAYTRSQNLLILCGEAAVVWQDRSTAYATRLRVNR